MNNLVVIGKRKTSIAKVCIKEGKGIITLNKKPLSFLTNFQQLEINEPIILAKDVLGKFNFDIEINVKGGGSSSRVEASRLAIARAILKYTQNDDIRRAFLAYDRNLIVADTRRKEACKPGDSKARAKRQTSFR